jgi:hypothetical protein
VTVRSLGAKHRKRKAEELEAARKAEEALMEARRRELLSEENGYWRKRMAQELAARALAGSDAVSATAASAAANPGAQVRRKLLP